MLVEWVGLGLQLLGTALAFYVLVKELLAPKTADFALPAGNELERTNPWRHPPGGEWTPSQSGAPRVVGASRRSFADIDVRKLHASVQETLATMRSEAAEDWEKQRLLDSELMARDRAQLENFGQRLGQAQRATARRVLWELVGLSLCRSRHGPQYVA